MERAVTCHRNLVGKHTGKRHLGTLQCRWEESIKMNLTNIRSEGVGWIYLAYKREKWLALVNMVKKQPVPKRGDFLD
jgi:hypothetical protein